MKESPHITLTAEQDKRETTICVVWASVIVFGMLALMLHGLAYFSSATVTGQDIYAREIMQKKILRLEELTAGLYLIYSDNQKKNSDYKYKKEKLDSEDKKKRLDYKPPSNAGWVSPARITKGGWAR